MILQGSDLMARPSALGLIMGGRTDEELTQTAKNWAEEQFLVSHDRMEPSFQGNKYTKKGWDVEDSAIDDYVKYTGVERVIKNEERFENEIIGGTPDVLLMDGKTVVDIKSPWSHVQFNKYASFEPHGKYPCPSASYFWQLQAYMWLTGRDYAELAYVLMNTPQNLLETYDGWVDYEGQYPLEKRVKIFGFERSNSHIIRIEKKVKLLRDYLDLVIIPYYT